MSDKECKLPVGCRLIDVAAVGDERGVLSFTECKGKLPFDVERVFWIYDVPQGKARGGHAHRTCHELVFAVAGAFTMRVDDGQTAGEVRMDVPHRGILIPSGMWCELLDFAPGTVCVVLASQPYDPTGYINTREAYKAYRDESDY